MNKTKILFAGESWHSNLTEGKGFNFFSVGMYEEAVKWIREALDTEEFDFVYLPSHKVPSEFPKTEADLKNFDVVILSDVGADSLLLSPETFQKSIRMPNRLKLLKNYVENGGSLCMIGGYLTFQGIDAKGRYHNTEIEEILPVNLSAYDLKNDSLINFLEELIKKNDLSPNQIDFEITESVFLDAAERDLENLNKIKKAGFYIYLDDFGKGYSSLSYLTKLPIDMLKLDMSFIRNLNQKKTRILVNKIIELSHELDFKVVAEGVERKHEQEILKEMDCDYIQGYYYYRPMPISELESIICLNCNNKSL